MNLNSNIQKINFRKLKLTDFKKFEKLFYNTFKKKISYKFFKWRYFNDRHSFCYGVFKSSHLIANVGMKAMQLNNKRKEIVYSRHTSMVAKKFRGKGIFTKLLEEVKKKNLSKSKMIIMWPNKNNFSSFGIKKSMLLKTKFYLFKSLNTAIETKKTNYYKSNDLKNFEFLIKNNNNFFFKDYSYFRKRYLAYKKNDYIINYFKLKNLKSFFILKKNINQNNKNYVILEHFGSTKIKQIHFRSLIKEKKEVVFWSKSKINKSNFILIDTINLNIGITKKIKNKNSLIRNKEFMPGDTDSFITIN